MRFLVDESTGPAVAEWLRENGHEVFSAFNEARGMQDADIIQKAFTDSWILVTNDKDFGEEVEVLWGTKLLKRLSRMGT